MALYTEQSNQKGSSSEVVPLDMESIFCQLPLFFQFVLWLLLVLKKNKDIICKFKLLRSISLRSFMVAALAQHKIFSILLIETPFRLLHLTI